MLNLIHGSYNDHVCLYSFDGKKLKKALLYTPNVFLSLPTTYNVLVQ